MTTFTSLLPTSCTITPVSTVEVITTKVYRQCLGVAWHGTGRCSSCGVQMNTGGICLMLIEVAPSESESG